MMFLKAIFVVSLLSLFVITGCSSKNDIQIIEVFRSKIGTNDAKLFIFSIVFVSSAESKSSGINDKNPERKHEQTRQGKNRGKKNNIDNKPNKQQSKQKQQDEMIDELETRLADKLAENNYCRAGFFELERSLNRTIFTIHGECNESATAADKKNFPQRKHVDKRAN